MKRLLLCFIYCAKCSFFLSYSRRKPKTVKVAAPGDDKEEMYWDDTGLSGVRITLNPMQKFQELDLNEDGANTDKSDTEDEEGGAAKGLLEWDNSDM